MVTTLVDAQLRGDASALNVLTSCGLFRHAQIGREFYPRVRRVRDTKPHWVTIALFDAQVGQQIFRLAAAVRYAAKLNARSKPRSPEL